MATITKTKPKLKATFVVTTATDVQQNFSKYAKMAAEGQDVVVEKNGKSLVRIISEKKGRPLLTDFVGILSGTPHRSLQEAGKEKAREYEATHRR